MGHVDQEKPSCLGSIYWVHYGWMVIPEKVLGVDPSQPPAQKSDEFKLPTFFGFVQDDDIDLNLWEKKRKKNPSYYLFKSRKIRPNPKPPNWYTYLSLSSSNRGWVSSRYGNGMWPTPRRPAHPRRRKASGAPGSQSPERPPGRPNGYRSCGAREARPGW